jgi:hypothetical protein
MNQHGQVTLVPKNSLTCATPEEGRQLAMRMAIAVVEAVQPDETRRKVMRDLYANDPAMLIAITQSVAAEFGTIAAANNYWRK